MHSSKLDGPDKAQAATKVSRVTALPDARLSSKTDLLWQRCKTSHLASGPRQCLSRQRVRAVLLAEKAELLQRLAPTAYLLQIPVAI